MAENCMTLEIITPEGGDFRKEISEFSGRTTDGSIGILKDHAPLIAPLGAGEVKYVADGKAHTVTVGDGFLRVEHNVITLLAKSYQENE